MLTNEILPTLVYIYERGSNLPTVFSFPCLMVMESSSRWHHEFSYTVLELFYGLNKSFHQCGAGTCHIPKELKD
jgi:hypothetical protein